MEADCVGVVSESSSGGFVVVMVVLEDFWLVLWSSWMMILWCWNQREEFLRCFSLMSVVGNMFVIAGECLFGIVIQCKFLDGLDFLELLEEVRLLVWWR